MAGRKAHLGKEEDRRRRSEEILEAALTVFARQGYAGTTIEDIAQELDCSKAALYYYFPGKEAMVKALIDGAMDRAAARMDEILARSPDPEVQLRGLFEYYIDDYGERRGFFNIYHQVAHFMDSILSPEEGRAMALRMAAMNLRITGILRAGIDAGLWRKEDPQFLGEILLGMVSGSLQQLSSRGPAARDPQTLKATLIELLIQSIRIQEEPWNHPSLN